jgi:hypothetical protein
LIPEAQWRFFYFFTRVSIAIQFTSQVLPPSVEKDFTVLISEEAARGGCAESHAGQTILSLVCWTTFRCFDQALCCVLPERQVRSDQLPCCSDGSAAQSRNLSLLPPKAGATNAHWPFWGSSRPGPLKNSRSRIAGLRLFLIDDST